MRKLFWSSMIVATVVGCMMIGSCNKNGDTRTIIEPITLIHPDSPDVKYVGKGVVYPIDIQFTTDRPIAYVRCMYSLDTPAHLSGYPDTLFYVILDTLASSLSNKYLYHGFYTVPTTLTKLKTISFDVNMIATGNPSDPLYPHDTVSVDKRFTMYLR